MNTSSIRRLCVVAAILLGVVARSGWAQQALGAIEGRVTDKASGQPLVGAQVSVLGTTLRALTDRDGRYHLGNVPTGAVSIRILLIGYVATVRRVTTSAGERVQADVALPQSVIGLDAIVVTATGNQAAREAGTAAHNVDAAAVTKLALPTNMSDLLLARTPGVTVLPSGGTSGTGTRIRIRGSNSVSLSNDPVLVLDGVRIENTSSSSSVGVGGQVPSRINDISPEDLESVQVASGPSSSVLFGTDAANGVIQMTTRRGQQGPTRWTLSSEGGFINDMGSYPANYTGLDSLGKQCTLTRVAESGCAQQQLRVFNPIEQNSPFRTGHRALYGVSAAGGNEVTTFYVAGHFNRENGVYPVNEDDQVNLVANLHDQVRGNFDFQITTLYTSGKLRLPENDNNMFGVLSSGYLGSSDSANGKGGYGFLTPAQSFSIATFQNVDHFTGGVQANYRPRDFLELHAVAGTDFTSRFDEKTFYPGAVPASFNLIAGLGNRSANPFQLYNWTANVWGTASFVLTPNLTSTTNAGFQYYHARAHGVLARRDQLTAGTNSLTGGVIPTDSEQTLETVTIGRFVEERLAYKNRLFVSGALRSDDNSSFGRRFGNILYPKGSVSWVLSEEPFFPSLGWLSSLRLRAAYGSAGLHPGPLDAQQYYVSTPVVVNSADVPGITVGSLGNAALKPEHTNEVEGGFDADFRPLAGHLEFTYFSKVSHDALIAVTLPPSCGCGNFVFRNLGSASNKGVEIAAGATLLERDNVTIDLNVSAWGTRSRVVTLGPDVQAIIFGLGGFSQRHQPAYAPGSYFMVPYTYSDANRDGLIDTNEVHLGTKAVFLGQPLPDHGGTVVASVTLLKHWQLYGLLDGRFGNKQFNSTEQFRCGLGNCQGRNDPKASLADQAAAVANIKGTQAGYIEDAGFVKLREVSLTYDAPAVWAGKIGASALSVTIAGRNLHTWTNYRGLDPEVNEAGQNNFTTADFLTQPPVRYWIGRLNITF